jgi:hypothetical protein
MKTIREKIDSCYLKYEKIYDLNIDSILKRDRYPFADIIIRNEFNLNEYNMQAIYKNVVLLNSLYSTNIYATFNVALKISRVKNFIKLVTDGDPGLVRKIRNNRIKCKDKDFYSFSTKYCHHYNPVKYPIYDSFVEDAVYKLLKKYDKENKIIKGSMKDYKYFKKKVDRLIEIWKLPEEYKYRKVDKYLWEEGKKISKNKERAKKLKKALKNR